MVLWAAVLFYDIIIKRKVVRRNNPYIFMLAVCLLNIPQGAA